ncbi:MAG: hemolysin III family protein [Leptothrix sp. (in: b-proteobacteria)]
MTTLTQDRDQTAGEELANALSHGLGFLLALAALPILVNGALQRGGAANVVAASLFAGTMIVLYLVSTLYHAMPVGRAKIWLNRFDHAAIYLFIAGSYMPFLFGVLRGAWGWSLFGVVWAAALLGVVIKLLDRLKHPIWSTGLYVAMGWVVLIAAVPLFERMSTAGLAWLLAGAFSYTIGAVIFLFDSKLRYVHFIWHLFVMGGSACHFCAALWHANA